MEKAFGIRWKVVGFAGGGAFLLSFLLGILSGNPFLTILFRAFLWGVIFAVLGGGAAFVIDRFIPQLAGGGEGPSEFEQKAGRASNVDIVLDGESTIRDEPIEELSLEDADAKASQVEESPGGSEYANVRDIGRTVDDAKSTLVDFPDSGEGEFAADLVSPDEAAAATSPAGTGDGGEAGSYAPPGRQPASGTGLSAPQREKRLDEGDLDVLPDMSTFESSFSPVTEGGVVTDTDSFDSFGTDTLKKGDMDKDPETYVKAVRTVIKRDEGKK